VQAKAMPLPHDRLRAVEGPENAQPAVMFRQIASAALVIEPDFEKVWHWMLKEPIAELDGKTAVDLVAEGHGERVLALLQDVESGKRGL
jgi:hypothetical protein